MSTPELDYMAEERIRGAALTLLIEAKAILGAITDCYDTTQTAADFRSNVGEFIYHARALLAKLEEV